MSSGISMTSKPRAARFATTALTYTEFNWLSNVSFKGKVSRPLAKHAWLQKAIGKVYADTFKEFKCGSRGLTTSTEPKGYAKEYMPTVR